MSMKMDYENEQDWINIIYQIKPIPLLFTFRQGILVTKMRKLVV